MVDLAALVLPVQTGIWLQADKEVVQHCRVGVYGAVEEANLSVTGIYLPQSCLQFHEFLLA